MGGLSEALPAFHCQHHENRGMRGTRPVGWRALSPCWGTLSLQHPRAWLGLHLHRHKAEIRQGGSFTGGRREDPAPFPLWPSGQRHKGGTSLAQGGGSKMSSQQHPSLSQPQSQGGNKC